MYCTTGSAAIPCIDSGSIYALGSALEKTIAKTKKAMQDAAKKLDFLEAAQYRDELIKLEDLLKGKN